MAAELGINLPGGPEQRRAGLESDGEFACFEFGDTTHFRKDCVIYLERQRTIRVLPWKQRMVGKGTKWEEVRKVKKINGQEEIISLACDFRKLEIILLEMRRFIRTKMAISEENGAKLVEREGLISRTVLRQSECGSKIGALIQQFAIARVLLIPVST